MSVNPYRRFTLDYKCCQKEKHQQKDDRLQAHNYSCEKAQSGGFVSK
ncbi:MAG: hypothetical protein WCA39_02180 [Nitrososphaeraceae archaeon]